MYHRATWRERPQYHWIAAILGHMRSTSRGTGESTYNDYAHMHGTRTDQTACAYDGEPLASAAAAMGPLGSRRASAHFGNDVHDDRQLLDDGVLRLLAKLPVQLR